MDIIHAMTESTRIQRLSSFCGRHPTEEKWLIAPSFQVGYQWLCRASLLGHPVLNFLVKPLDQLVTDMLQSRLPQLGLRIASNDELILILSQILDRACFNAHPYLSESKRSIPLARNLLRTIQELRFCGIDSQTVVAKLHGDENQPPNRLLEVGPGLGELAAILGSYELALQQLSLADYPQLYSIATDELPNGQITLLHPNRVVVPIDLETKPIVGKFLNQLLGLNVFPLGFERHRRVSDVQIVELGSIFRPTGPVHGIEVVRAETESKEVHFLLQYCLKNGIALENVEVLYTDRETYVPLIQRALSQLNAPLDVASCSPAVTFSEGFEVSTTKPGRALKQWVTWERSNHSRPALIELLRNRVIRSPSFALHQDRRTTGKLIELVRNAKTDFFGPGSVPDLGLSKEWAFVSQMEPRSLLNPSPDPVEVEHLLCHVLQNLLRCAVSENANAKEIVSKAIHFLEHCIHASSEQDREAASNLLDAARQIRLSLATYSCLPASAVWDWLCELPTELRVSQRSPLAGHLYVNSVEQGGHSGRRYTFILGFDDLKFPRNASHDPVLPDHFRHQIGNDVPTAYRRQEQSIKRFVDFIERYRGRIVICYAARSDRDNRKLNPSRVLETLSRRSRRSVTSTENGPKGPEYESNPLKPGEATT